MFLIWEQFLCQQKDYDYHYYEKFGFKKFNNTFSFYGPVNSEKVLILPLKDELKNNEYKMMEFN